MRYESFVKGAQRDRERSFKFHCTEGWPICVCLSVVWPVILPFVLAIPRDIFACPRREPIVLVTWVTRRRNIDNSWFGFSRLMRMHGRIEIPRRSRSRKELLGNYYPRGSTSMRTAVFQGFLSRPVRSLSFVTFHFSKYNVKVECRNRKFNIRVHW